MTKELSSKDLLKKLTIYAKKELESFKLGRSSILTAIQAKALEVIIGKLSDEEQMKKTPLRDLTAMLAKSFEIERTLEGKTTKNFGVMAVQLVKRADSRRKEEDKAIKEVDAIDVEGKVVDTDD